MEETADTCHRECMKQNSRVEGTAFSYSRQGYGSNSRGTRSLPVWECVFDPVTGAQLHNSSGCTSSYAVMEGTWHNVAPHSSPGGAKQLSPGRKPWVCD